MCVIMCVGRILSVNDSQAGSPCQWASTVVVTVSSPGSVSVSFSTFIANFRVPCGFASPAVRRHVLQLPLMRVGGTGREREKRGRLVNLTLRGDRE